MLHDCALRRLIDALIRWCRDYRARYWPTAKGEVQSCQVFYSSVVVTYAYKVDNERYSGIHQRRCYSDPEEYARRFAPNWPLVVRYSGADPGNSAVIGDDQTSPPAWATRHRDVDD